MRLFISLFLILLLPLPGSGRASQAVRGE